MSAMEPLYCLMRIPVYHLSKEEIFILEVKLFNCICDEIREYFRKKYNDYFQLMKFSKERENTMLEINLIRLLIKDILTSEEYTLEGISRYADIHEDVLQEVFVGQNAEPSARLLRRIIELHCSIRRELYNEIMKSIAIQYLKAA